MTPVGVAVDSSSRNVMAKPRPNDKDPRPDAGMPCPTINVENESVRRRISNPVRQLTYAISAVYISADGEAVGSGTPQKEIGERVREPAIRGRG